MDSGLSSFFDQIPTGLIVTFCGSGILLVVAVVLMVTSRSRKVQAALNTASAAAQRGAGSDRHVTRSNINASASNSAYSGGDGDLPDLDSLLGGEGMVNDLSAAHKAHTGTFNVTLADGESLEAVEVLTVLRDVADGGLLVQIGDTIHRNPPAFADAEFKRRFNGAVSELAKSLSNVKAAAPIVTPPPAESVEAVEMPPPRIDETPRIKPDMPPETLPFEKSPFEKSSFEKSPSTTSTSDMPKTNQSGIPIPGDLPKFNLSHTPLEVKPGRRVPRPTQPVPEIDIGGSVEAYLQHRLSYTPEYVGRSIHIRNAPKGGVTIEVDGKFFDAISDVDDEEVREFLRATIEEWQSRQ